MILMRANSKVFVWVAAVVFAVATLPAAALDKATKERLNTIERKLDSRGLMDMLNRLEQLQRNVQEMRGEIEVQNHQLEDMQRRQREQYMDIDRRLQALETGTVGAPLPIADKGNTLPPPVTPVAPPPVVAPGAVNPSAGKEEYDTALAILREGRYADAAQAFQQFLARHPTSSYVSNANYWLGETYYVTRDFNQALSTFTGLVTQHPQSPKVPDSRLKIGYIQYEKKDWKAARRELESVVSSYPGTTAARLASDRLARMKKERR